jgi:hypothetical protein
MASGNVAIWDQAIGQNGQLAKEERAQSINCRLALSRSVQPIVATHDDNLMPPSPNTTTAARETIYFGHPYAIPGKDGVVVEGIQPSLISARESEHISRIDIELFVRREQLPEELKFTRQAVESSIKKHKAKMTDQEPKKKLVTHRASIQFTLANLKGLPSFDMIRYAMTSDARPELEEIARDFDIDVKVLQQSRMEGQLFRGEFVYNGAALASCALFTNVTYGEFTPLMEKMKTWLIEAPHNPVKFEFIAANDEFGNIFTPCISSLSETAPNMRGIHQKLLGWYTQKAIDPRGNNRNLRMLDEFPRFRIPAKFNFLSQEEYFTIHYVSLKHELDLSQEAPSSYLPYAVRFMQTANFSDKVYWLLIDQSMSPRLRSDEIEQNIRFTPGDHIQVNIRTNRLIEEEDWHGTIVESPFWAHPDDTCAIIHRPWVLEEGSLSKEDGDWDDLVIPTEVCIAVPDQSDPDTVTELLGACDYMEVNIKLNGSHDAIVRQISGLANFWDKRCEPKTAPKIQLLLANQPSLLEPVHLFQPFLDGGYTQDQIQHKVDEAKVHFEMPASQRRALDMVCQPQPGGILLIAGAAGSGKSYTMDALIWIIFQLKKETPQTRMKVLFTTPANQLVDHIATKLANHATKIGGKGLAKGVVARAHTDTTEKKIGKHRANTRRQANEEVPAWHLEESTGDVTKTLAQLEVARDVYHRFKESSTPVLAGINDKRLTKPHLALATIVYAITGAGGNTEIHNGCNRSTHPLGPATGDDPDCFSTFRRHDENWSKGTILGDADKAAYTIAFNECVDWVLENRIDVLVSTISNACQPRFTSMKGRGDHIDLLVVEEASKAPEGEFAGVTGFWKPRFTILLGDSAQLKPHYYTKKQHNFEFDLVFKRSIFKRLIVAGYTCIDILEQFRFGPDICRLLNIICPSYKHVFPTPQVCNRSSLEDARKVMKRLGVASGYTVAWFEVSNSRAERENYGNLSTKNPINVGAAMYFMFELLSMDVKPSEILIVTPYSAQNALYVATLKKLPIFLRTLGVQWNDIADNIRDIEVVTVDSIQGMQRRFVIFDTVVTEVLGHVEELERVVTAITRAVDAVLFLGNYVSLQQNVKKHQWAGSALNHIVNHCKRDPQCSFITPGVSNIWSIEALNQYITNRENIRRNPNIKGRNLAGLIEGAPIIAVDVVATSSTADDTPSLENTSGGWGDEGTGGWGNEGTGDWGDEGTGGAGCSETGTDAVTDDGSTGETSASFTDAHTD